MIKRESFESDRYQLDQEANCGEVLGDDRICHLKKLKDPEKNLSTWYFRQNMQDSATTLASNSKTDFGAQLRKKN